MSHVNPVCDHVNGLLLHME